MFVVLIISIFSFTFGHNCIDKIEVELWGECYNIEETTKLSVSGAGLKGSIPLQIGDLSNLYFIDLSNNRLSGSIPSSIGKLIDLEFLYLQDNQLSGRVPELKNMLKLKQLNFKNNNLEN